ncbi:MAG: Ca-activated chloride channel family protein [Crocinitomicaceae bacterium]|jgi:Ca-activated chloride channel family protein
MMKHLVILFFALTQSFVYGQVEFSMIKHDFGSLEPYSARYVDLKLSNKGSKQEWLLSVKKTSEVTYIVSKQIIEKDSSIIVRLHVNPSKKGKFSYVIDVFTSDRGEATKVKLTGSMNEIAQDGSNMMTACPSFSQSAGGRNPNKFDLTVVTIDKITREPLSKSKVTMLQGGQPVWTNHTDKKGSIKEEATLGLSYFYAQHEGYYPAELGAYVNFKRNYIVVELERGAIVAPPIVPEDTIELIAELPPEPEIIIEINEELEVDLSTSIDTSDLTTEAPPELAELDPDDFNDRDFRPVNVVFVLDVSSSMQQVDKIELMKYALFQLTDMIRPQDKMGIVTYASDARVLLTPTFGTNKEKIREEVTNLRAFGYTSGGEGIKLGYKQAYRARLVDGVNHVIVITDGAFNRNSDDYKRYVKKYHKKGITLSVVGIKNKSVDEEEMRDAATLGGGHYIPIFGLADARHNLRQEIRLLTFKR